MLNLHLLAGKDGERKKPIPYPIQTIQQMTSLGLDYKNPKERFLFYWLYLTGQRITEALSLKRSDINLMKNEDGEFLVVQSRTLKNRIQPRRSIPIPTGREEQPMTSYVVDYLSRFKQDDYIFGRLTRTNAYNLLAKVVIKQTFMHNITYELFDAPLEIYPHYLRHCRASHLAMYRNFGLYQLMQYFGWSSNEMASVYASMNWESLAKLFAEKK